MFQVYQTEREFVNIVARSLSFRMHNGIGSNQKVYVFQNAAKSAERSERIVKIINFRHFRLLFFYIIYFYFCNKTVEHSKLSSYKFLSYYSIRYTS
jgi:hypothetical protein